MRSGAIGLVGLVIVVATIAIAIRSDASETSRSGGTPVEINGADADAKSNARNMASYVESCFASTQSYTQCTAGAGSGVPIGSAAGQVEVTAASDSAYTVVAHSGSGTSFVMEHSADGTFRRTCSAPGRGGCMTTGAW